MRVADQTMTINVFNTLRYMDDRGECHHLQEENTGAAEDSDIICCSKFIQIKDFEELKKEDVEELDETSCETRQVSSFTICPGMRFETLDFSEFTSPKPSLEHAPSLELKPLPPHLKSQGNSPTIYMHKIILEECHINSVEPQRRLNPAMKKVVMNEIIKWLDAGVIYPISDSSWVSPVQCVLKKGGITVVTNEENEFLPT
ncbi:hypothetical protein V6N11_001284 [Hibiscus sabdariffa]|uniref:Reverse transcriptase domain-containing protein n=1 Tax=Hibiscus sabdariffa TaxID=183260 RepID=A0ABR2RZW0_9ROSI